MPHSRAGRNIGTANVVSSQMVRQPAIRASASSAAMMALATPWRRMGGSVTTERSRASSPWISSPPPAVSQIEVR
jgi:hypothetical protein